MDQAIIPAVAVVRHTLPVTAKRASMTCVQRRSAHRIRGTTLVVGTGGAVRPIYPLLVRARPSVDRSDDLTSLRRSKDSRLSQGHVYRPLPCFGRSFPGPRNKGFNRRLSPPGFPQCPTVRGLRGALAPSTEMSRMTIYGADLLERDGRAFHLVPSADHLGGSADAHGARLTARRPLRAVSVRSTSDSDRTGAPR
jgi:hypothetical protein